MKKLGWRAVRMISLTWIALALAAGGAVCSAGTASRAEFSPFWGALFGGEYEGFAEEYGYGDIAQEDAGCAGFRIAYLATPYWGFETTVAFARTRFIFERGGFFEGDGETITDVNLVRVIGAFVFTFARGRAVPFIDTGAGFTLYEPDEEEFESKTRFTACFGTGLRLYFNEHVGMRFDLRGNFTFIEPREDRDYEWDDDDDWNQEGDWEVLPEIEASMGLLFG